MEGQESQRHLSAIMFSDIVGYSKMMGDDEQGTLVLLQEHNDLLVPIIERHRGSILKFIGDAILASFASAADAVHCAVEIQQALTARNKGKDRQILVRIGIHIGDVTRKGGDVFGDGVNIAARIQPLAEPGGICISQTVYHVVQAHPELRMVSLGRRQL
ncbi:MAG TPA: adenylate/guanylate cyclase domain-containing protein, partial [Elusimicrobiota bacterium]|nr:adenylate/guanylate cyclase domain-containing protein [Elusimicrobiota bacterium]